MIPFYKVENELQYLARFRLIGISLTANAGVHTIRKKIDWFRLAEYKIHINLLSRKLMSCDVNLILLIVASLVEKGRIIFVAAIGT